MKRLQRLRESNGWSRAELARRATMNATTVGLIESGRLQPYPSQLLKLAQALNVDAPKALQLVEDVVAEAVDAA